MRCKGYPRCCSVSICVNCTLLWNKRTLCGYVLGHPPPPPHPPKRFECCNCCFAGRAHTQLQHVSSLHQNHVTGSRQHSETGQPWRPGTGWGNLTLPASVEVEMIKQEGLCTMSCGNTIQCPVGRTEPRTSYDVQSSTGAVLATVSITIWACLELRMWHQDWSQEVCACHNPNLCNTWFSF